MKLDPSVEKFRTNNGRFKSPAGATYGHFEIPYRTVLLTVIAADGEETMWEHVSVSLPNRCPNWQEMSFIKDLFFAPEETVLQFHPPKSEYVDCHPYCLHLWKPLGQVIDLPPRILV